MASITQTIPTYNGGISQQPDEFKLPGQVVEAKNVLPDVVDRQSDIACIWFSQNPRTPKSP